MIWHQRSKQYPNRLRPPTLQTYPAVPSSGILGLDQVVDI